MSDEAPNVLVSVLGNCHQWGRLLVTGLGDHKVLGLGGRPRRSLGVLLALFHYFYELCWDHFDACLLLIENAFEIELLCL